MKPFLRLSLLNHISVWVRHHSPRIHGAVSPLNLTPGLLIVFGSQSALHGFVSSAWVQIPSASRTYAQFCSYESFVNPTRTARVILHGPTPPCRFWDKSRPSTSNRAFRAWSCREDMAAELVLREGWAVKESGQVNLFGQTNWKRRWFRLVRSSEALTWSYYRYHNLHQSLDLISKRKPANETPRPF